MLRRKQAVGVLALVGGGLLVIGSFLPWLTATAPFVGTISRSGLDNGGDGTITLAVGVVACLIGLLDLLGTLDPRRTSWALIGAAVIGGIIAGADYNTVSQRIAAATADSPLISASVGSGLWVIIVGVVVLAVAFAIAVSRSRSFLGST